MKFNNYKNKIVWCIVYISIIIAAVLFFNFDDNDQLLSTNNDSRVIGGTTNEWDSLVYKPAANSLLLNINNRVQDTDKSHKQFLNAPLDELARWLLIEDRTGLYIIEEGNGKNYNKFDKNFYAVIKLKNLARTPTVANIYWEPVCRNWRDEWVKLWNPDKIDNYFEDIKIEIPPNTDKALSIVQIYIPINRNVDTGSYNMQIIKKLSDGNIEPFNINIYVDDERLQSKYNFSINDLNPSKITIKYGVENYNYNIKHTEEWAKPYLYDVDSYQKNDGVWTSSVVYDVDKYIEDMTRWVLLKGIVKHPIKSINALISGRQDALNVIIVVVIGLIIIFVIKRNKNHLSGEY